jgi:hypothetical protein
MKNTGALTIATLALTSQLEAGQGEVFPAAVQVGRRTSVESALQLERARVGVESKIVKGAPYSGEAVTETLQVLADGNRIVRKSVTRVYRDSEGRTRRENVGASGEVTLINISDPVGESQYTLDSRTKTAHRNGVIMAGGRGGWATATVKPFGDGTVLATTTPDGNVRVEARSAEAARKEEAEKAAAGTAGGGSVAVGGRGAAGPTQGGSVVFPRTAVPGATTASKEDLGQQVIEGVLATGSRSVTVIPAGAIGNEQAINILSEQWFSEELHVLVMTKHIDPRQGTTTYRLTNVVQAEPHRSLFEVPADYTLRDSVIRRQIP